MAELIPSIKFRGNDANGDPLVGGKLYTYAAGTTTPQATYTDQSGSAQNTNPVILDANGYADVWIGGLSYKFILKDANDVIQYTVDNVRAPGVSAAAITFTSGLLDVAALKAVTVANRSEALSVFVESLNAFFYFASASTATGDDVLVVTPTAGTGRWLRVGTTNITTSDFVDMAEQGSDPASPASGFSRFYAKAAGLFRKTAAAVITQLATLTGTETFTNKTLSDSTTAVANSVDPTKKMGWSVGGQTTGTTLTNVTNQSTSQNLDWPDVGSGDAVVTKKALQVLTNKSIVAGNNTISGITNSNLSGSAGITNANQANMATQTIKGRTTAGSGAPEDLTATQATAILNAVVGDSGSGGTKGLVPAPGSGDAAAGKFLKADGTFATPAGGGGGGGALQWVEDADAPITAIENAIRIYQFVAGLTQPLYCVVKVPNSYVAGAPVKLRMPFYSGDSSGNVLMTAVATLIRTGTDAMSSTTNQRTSTNTAVTLGAGTVNKGQAVIFDLSDSTGNINSVAISAGDLILVKLIRGTDTATSDVKVPVYSAEVTFT